MRVTLIDSGRAPGLGQRLERRLRAAGVSTRLFQASDLPVAHCKGCFDCWTKTPGRCTTQDAGGEITAAAVASDVVLFLTELTFAGYDADCKRSLDRMLGIISPFFQRVDGAIHHQPRYENSPALGVVATLSEGVDASPREKAILDEVVRRNAVNFHAPRAHVWFRTDGCPRAGDQRELEDAVVEWSTRRGLVGDSDRPRVRPFPADLSPSSTSAVPRSALLLVGSGRPPGASTSEVLGRSLLAHLERAHVATATAFGRQAIHPSGRRRLLEAIDAADLLVVAAPVYCDGLPSVLTSVLESLATEGLAGKQIAALINHGFPGPRHGETAAAMVEAFADRAGAAWVGGLVRAEGGVIHGRPLETLGGMVTPTREALALAAAALAEGKAVPVEAVEQMARPILGSQMYTWLGNMGWKRAAKRHGLKAEDLRARPYETAH